MTISYCRLKRLISRITTSTLGMAALSVLVFAAEARADKSLLVKAKREDGSESPILQKVLVTSANAFLVSAPGETAGDALDPFTIFFRLKTDTGSLVEKAGKDEFWRVGDEEGNPAGWIKTTSYFKSDDGKSVLGPAVKEWNTRLVLDPQTVATREKPLNLLDPKSKEVMIPFGGAIDSGNGRALAFVLGGANEDEEYPCEFFIGRTRTGSEELNIDDLKVEVAFVLEMTDFMEVEWDGITTLSLLKDIVLSASQKITASEELKGRCRLAVVEYQDAMGAIDGLICGEPRRPTLAEPNICSDFGDDLQGLRASLERLRPESIGGDWPEDGIAGLAKAISGLTWSKTSSKHIILFGMGALQTRSKGSQTSYYDINGMSTGWNILTKVNENYGWSTTGMDLADIIQAGLGVSGNDLKALLNRKVFHTVQLGKPLENVDPEWERISGEAIRWSDEELQRRANDGGAEFIEALESALAFQAVSINRKRAETQYRELAKNGSATDLVGIFEQPQPTAEGVRNAGDRIKKAIEDSFSAFEQSLRENGEARGQNGEIGDRVVEIADAFKKQLKDKESVTVLGAPLNVHGQEVAKLKLLVFKSELVRLRSTLDGIYKRFRGKAKRSQRQDARKLLDELKAAVASASAGQEFDEDTRLDDVIGDLPLRTPVLATSARALAAMPVEDFERWLGQLEFAGKRARDLVENGGNWEKHTGGIGSEFGFIEQSQMP